VSITTSTTLESFFASMVTRIQSQLPATIASTRIFVVDRLTLQSGVVPSIQIEPLNLTTIGENSGMNAMVLEYRIHVVVRVELDLGKRDTKRLLMDGSTGILPRGAFPLAFEVAKTLAGFDPSTGVDAQVLLRVENGQHDDIEGLASAFAQFRTMIRTVSDA